MTINNIKTTTGQQFFHVELYGKKVNKNSAINTSKRKSKRGRPTSKDISRALNANKRNRLADKVSKQRTVRGIINEAERSHGYCDHVLAPQPPLLIFGIDLPKLEEKIDKIYSSAKNLVAKKDGDLATRKIREDQKLLLAGVASNPRLSADYFSNPSTKKMVDLWILDCLEFLKNEYGDRLQTAVVHLDENHPHIHFYCLPEVYEATIDGHTVSLVRGIDTIHDGKRAEKQVEMQAKMLKGKDKILLKQNAYKSAMQKVQDRYYDAVSSSHGHQRLGPGRKRFGSRAEYFEWLNDQESYENTLFVQKAKDHVRSMTVEKLKSELSSRRKELKMASENLVTANTRLRNFNKKAEALKKEKVNKINQHLSNYRKERKSEIELEIEDELREENLHELKELSYSINNNVFIFSETKRVLHLQNKHIDELEKENVDLMMKDRRKGVELSNTRKELNVEKQKNKDLNLRFSRLEKTYNALVDKFNFLYESGKDYFDKKYGKLQKFLKKVSDLSI